MESNSPSIPVPIPSSSTKVDGCLGPVAQVEYPTVITPPKARGPFPPEILFRILKYHTPKKQKFPPVKEVLWMLPLVRSVLDHEVPSPTFFSIRLVNKEWYEIASEIFYSSNTFGFGNVVSKRPLSCNISRFHSALSVIPRHQLHYIRKIHLLLHCIEDPSSISSPIYRRSEIDAFISINSIAQALVDHFPGIQKLQICSRRPVFASDSLKETRDVWEEPTKLLLSNLVNLKSLAWRLEACWSLPSQRTAEEAESMRKTLSKLKRRSGKQHVTLSLRVPGER